MPMVTWRPDEEGELRALLAESWAQSGMLTSDQVRETVDRLTTYPDDTPPASDTTPTVVAPLGMLFDAVRTHCR
ncbi:hypothetical protein LO772_09185 [Yinghuangia sp. ASG 101]|uniref:hypothetical protein n=1 Tax=Yinghuangia sp. ASG 101 TaxID=2896848 RepID=UPI001E5B169B|nr:hypothetical protein [Yinghuangia sp. ASG 101]UGQ13747.1 hypothetical protein LO772_09185 [Yinghuangia sp. ASG 101]